MVVIVTATNDFVTRPIAAEFGVPELLAVELERTPDIDGQPGWITGNILGVPSATSTRGKSWGADWPGATSTSPSIQTPSTTSR